jgi:hypothetical protein
MLSFRSMKVNITAQNYRFLSHLCEAMDRLFVLEELRQDELMRIDVRIFERCNGNGWKPGDHERDDRGTLHRTDSCRWDWDSDQSYLPIFRCRRF